MPGRVGSLTYFEDGAGSSDAGGGYVAAAKAAAADPHSRAYTEDRDWRAMVFRYQYLLSASSGELEAFYKFLPPLSRGMLVPDGYPLQEAGMLGAYTNTFPRIVPLDIGTADDAVLTWSNPDTSLAWTEDLKAAYPALQQIPARESVLLSTVMAQGVVVGTDSQGVPASWRYKGQYFSFMPDKLFDQLFHSEQIVADPSSYYYQQNYKSWLQPNFHESGRNFAEAVVVAVVAAEAIGAAGIDGSAGAGAGGAGGGAGATVTDATPVSDAVQPIAPTNLTGGLSTLQPVTAASAGGGTVAAIGNAIEAGAVKVAGGVAVADILSNEKKPTAAPAQPVAGGSATPIPKNSRAEELLIGLIFAAVLAS